MVIISGNEIGEFIRTWSSPIPHSLKEIISSGDLFISSGFKRTHESFQMLGVCKFEINNLFNEAELSYGMGKSIKMPLIIWLFALRILWRIGLNRNSESYEDFTKRIVKGTDFITENRNKKHIIVMAHGFVNHMIKRDWKVLLNNGGHGYWSYSTLGRVKKIKEIARQA